GSSRVCFRMPYNRTAIQAYATNTSTATVAAKMSAGGSKIRKSAAWLAPPPIQDPANVANPFHTSPETTCGANSENSHTANGPPSTMPIMPAKKSKPTFLRSAQTSLKLILRVKSNRQAGKRYPELMLYNPGASPDMTSNELNKPGTK